MNDQPRYDIFICGGSHHFAQLQNLLPKLFPFGRVHLASITLRGEEIEALRPHYDVLHEPHYHADGRKNFEHFCVRDINRLATCPHFIKLDCDTVVRDDWVEYVDGGLAAHPDSVLFGPIEGRTCVDMELSGPLVRKKLGRDVRVVNGRKVIGGFYVGQTRFFRQHEFAMRTIHEFLTCFKDGRRCSLSWCASEWDGEDMRLEPIVSTYKAWGDGPEDHLRCLVVHAMGEGDRIRCIPSGQRVVITW
jgi:hypothetical protein